MSTRDEANGGDGRFIEPPGTAADLVKLLTESPPDEDYGEDVRRVVAAENRRLPASPWEKP